MKKTTESLVMRDSKVIRKKSVRGRVRSCFSLSKVIDPIKDNSTCCNYMSQFSTIKILLPHKMEVLECFQGKY